MTAIIPETTPFLHLPGCHGEPRDDNGEDIIDNVLNALGIWHEYESITYMFRSPEGELHRGFRPDFPVFEAFGVPAYNVEVTWPDHPMQSGWKRDRCCRETIETKETKITKTWELHGIPTLLLNYQATIAIDRNPQILLGLISTMYEEKDEYGFFYPTGDDLKSRRDWRK